MNYSISSKRFDNFWLSDLLKQLVKYFQTAGIEFYVIGAENSELLIELTEIIESEITKAEGSILINQMLETHPAKKYAEVYNALIKLVDEFKS